MAASHEVVEQTTSVLQRATEANRSARLRRGNVIVVTEQDADDVMVTADLHGNRLNFERILDLADLDNHPRRHLVMQEVCHGGPTYPATTGCMSHLLLEDVADLTCRYPDRFHFILGNHELAELSDFPITKASRMLNLMFRCGLQEMYGQGADRVRKAHLDYLRSCPLAVRMDNGVFICHSAPEHVLDQGFDTSVLQRPMTDADLAPHGPAFRLVWGRDFGEDNAAAFARLVHASVLIHGHEPCSSGVWVPNRYQIILDCCGDRAAYVVLPTGGQLTHVQVAQRVQEMS